MITALLACCTDCLKYRLRLEAFSRSAIKLARFDITAAIWVPHPKHPALSNRHPLLAGQYHISKSPHKVPSGLHKLLHLLHVQLDTQRHEAPLGEVNVFGEHIVVEEGLEMGR